MTKEKWEKITGNIKDNFPVHDEGESHIDDEGGVDIEFIEFDGPLGRMRLEYVVKPVIMDKKTNYTRRIGSETQVTYVYSEDEKSHHLMAYKWDDNKDDWTEIDGDMFGD
jgi:hypothetical protein